MPSVSKSQRRFFGWIEHTPGSELPAKARKAKRHMTHEQMHDFAATKDKGLPEHARKRKFTYAPKGKR